MEACSKTNEPRKKKIVCIETGIVYNSISDCAKSMDLITQKISLVVNGKRNKTGGFTFKFLDQNNYAIVQAVHNDRIMNRKKHKKLFCNETGTIYLSVKEASQKLGINRSYIHDFLKGKVENVKGFTFRRL